MFYFEAQFREEEVLEIEEGSEGKLQKVPIEKVPFKKILTSISFLAVCYSGITVAALDFTIINMLPKYLKQVQNSNFLSDGLLRKGVEPLFFEKIIFLVLKDI